MTADQFLASLREDHRDCCLIGNCSDQGCTVHLEGIAPESLAIIHGEKYRDRHGDSTARICDRIIFANFQSYVVAAIELKGGNSIRMGDAVEQIRMGLKLAENLLGKHQIDDRHPLLIFGGVRMPQDVSYLQRNRVEFRNERKNVVWRDCNTRLDDILKSLTAQL